MTKKDYLIAKELKEKLSKEVDLVDFKVFGSRAKGAQDEETFMDAEKMLRGGFSPRSITNRAYYSIIIVFCKNYIFDIDYFDSNDKINCNT